MKSDHVLDLENRISTMLAISNTPVDKLNLILTLLQDKKIKLYIVTEIFEEDDGEGVIDDETCEYNAVAHYLDEVQAMDYANDLELKKSAKYSDPHNWRYEVDEIEFDDVWEVKDDKRTRN